MTPGLSISNYSITVDQYSISRIFLGDSVAVMNRPLATGLPSTSAWAGARGPSYFHRMSSPFPGLNNTWPVTAVLNRKTVSSLEPTDTFLPNNYSNRANNIYSVNIKLKLLGGGKGRYHSAEAVYLEILCTISLQAPNIEKALSS